MDGSGYGSGSGKGNSNLWIGRLETTVMEDVLNGFIDFYHTIHSSRVQSGVNSNQMVLDALSLTEDGLNRLLCDLLHL